MSGTLSIGNRQIEDSVSLGRELEKLVEMATEKSVNVYFGTKADGKVLKNVKDVLDKCSQNLNPLVYFLSRTKVKEEDLEYIPDQVGKIYLPETFKEEETNQKLLPLYLKNNGLVVHLGGPSAKKISFEEE